MMKKEIEYRGEKFKSFSELAKKYGLKYDIAYHRWRNNIPLEKPIGRLKEPFEYNGETFASFTELAKRYDLDYFTAYQRWHNNTPLEKAKQRQREIEYKGEKFKNFSELAERYNLEYSTARHRWLHNIPLEKPLKKPIGPFEYRGETFNSFSELAQKYGLDHSTARTRWFHNIPLDSPVRGKEIIEYKGKRFKSFSELGEKYGLKRGTARHRWVNNIPLERPLKRSPEQIERNSIPNEQVIEAIRRFISLKNRWPKTKDFLIDSDLPSIGTLQKNFGKSPTELCFEWFGPSESVPWTAETVNNAVAFFIKVNSRPPSYEDFSAKNRLPSFEVFLRETNGDIETLLTEETESDEEEDINDSWGLHF